MLWAVAVGVISGNDDGTLEPQGSATRAQVAMIMMQFDKLLKTPVEPEIPEA